jgi:hypothetical protein
MAQNTDDIIRALLAGWLQCLHNVDSLFQVVQLVPDWKLKMDEALHDPARIEATDSRFAPIYEAVNDILAGSPNAPALQRAVEKLQKPPD